MSWHLLNETCTCTVGSKETGFRHPQLYELTLKDGPRSVHAVICRSGTCGQSEILSMRDKTAHDEALSIAARWRWVCKVEGILLLLACAALAALLQVANL